MSTAVRDNMRRKSLSGEKSEEKSVKFSRQMISDIFFIEKLEKQYVKELFYTEKDIIGFQIDAMRKGERKARRNRERKMNRSSSDGKVGASRDKDDDDASSRSKKSHKSSEKKRSKDPSARRRYSNDDAPNYEPQQASERKKSKDPLRSSTKKSSGTTKRRGSDSSSSSTSEPSTKPKSTGTRDTLTQDQLLEKAMQWRKAANYRDDSDKLDPTITKQGSSQGNIAIEPWTQDMLVTKAKKWGETLSNSVVGGTVEKKDPPKPSAKTKQMAFLLAEDAKESTSLENIPEKKSAYVPPKLKESPTPEKKLSSDTQQLLIMLAREAKETVSSNSLEELSLSDDEASVELSELVTEANLVEEMHWSQNDFLTEAIERQKAREEAAKPINLLRGIVSSTMVSETFQNLTGETKTTNP
jgi:hypothetical protein